MHNWSTAFLLTQMKGTSPRANLIHLCEALNIAEQSILIQDLEDVFSLNSVSIVSLVNELKTTMKNDSALCV